MKTFSFGSQDIGEGYPCFIIAEAGVNHNGNVETACELVQAAKEAGADAVKFQTFKTDRLVARGAGMAEYQKLNTGMSGDQADLLRGLEINEEGFCEIFSYAKKLNMPIFSSPDEEESADFLDSLKVSAFKIGSGEVTNLPFLRHLGAKRRPIILSTGMASLAETALAVEALLGSGVSELALLQCVSAYPAPFEELNLRVMKTLKNCFGFPVGFSDHTMGTEAAVAAVAIGASLIEKHFTLDTSMRGPDHRCSLNPADFAMMIRQIRNVEKALGHGKKEPAMIELPTKSVVRKGLVAARNLSIGEVLTAKDVWVKRVSQEAILPGDLEKVVGMRLTRMLHIDEPMLWTSFKA